MSSVSTHLSVLYSSISFPSCLILPIINLGCHSYPPIFGPPPQSCHFHSIQKPKKFQSLQHFSPIFVSLYMNVFLTYQTQIFERDGNGLTPAQRKGSFASLPFKSCSTTSSQFFSSRKKENPKSANKQSLIGGFFAISIHSPFLLPPTLSLFPSFSLQFVFPSLSPFILKFSIQKFLFWGPFISLSVYLWLVVYSSIYYLCIFLPIVVWVAELYLRFYAGYNLCKCNLIVLALRNLTIFL